MGRITSRDVAKRANVSIATVSRVLNNLPYVSPTVQRRVWRAAHELNYQPSRAAQHLRAKRSHVLGLIISDIQNPFFTSIVRGIEDFAYQHSYSLVLCNSDENAEKEQLYLNVLRAEAVAGIILTTTSETNPRVQLLLDSGIPVVAIDRLVRNRRVDSVVVDNISGAFDAVSFLIQQGHRRIGFIGLPLRLTTGRERREGYLRALQKYDLPVLRRLIYVGDAKETGGYQGVMELFKREPYPTALFTANNLTTVGALKAIQELRLRVPNDVSLVAFDDLPWSSLLQPPLTSMAQPTYELGWKAAELLLRRITEPDAPPGHVKLQSRLIIRESVAAPAQRK